ncbi:hypothetical protein DXG01_015201 [Tephrocybe rancida]|nr:hypothetical protein DXG01_015201 [Tephrocybe rancida]
MPPPKQPMRAQQPSTHGFGIAFTSPKKRRDKFKTSTVVNLFGRTQEISRLRGVLDKLKRRSEEAPVEEGIMEAVVVDESPAEIPEPEAPWDTLEEPIIVDDPLPSPEFISSSQHPRPPRRIVPNQSTKRQYSNWVDALERLVEPLLEYYSSSLGQIPERIVALRSRCRKSGNCIMKTNLVLCLFQDCDCEDLVQVLVSNGLFPTAPTAPRIAVLIHLLDFYRALFERSCNAIHAMASVLNTFYEWRGFILLNKKGAPIQDAFRRGLGYAAQWYDNLVLRLEKCVDDAVVGADTQIRASDPVDVEHGPFPLSAALDIVPPSVSTSHQPSEIARELTLGECGRLLQQRCPACFGDRLFGQSLEDE